MKIKFTCNGIKDIPENDQKSITFISADAVVTGYVSLMVTNGTPASVSFEVGKDYDLAFTVTA